MRAATLLLLVLLPLLYSTTARSHSRAAAPHPYSTLEHSISQGDSAQQPLLAILISTNTAHHSHHYLSSILSESSPSHGAPGLATRTPDWGRQSTSPHWALLLAWQCRLSQP